MHFEKNPIYKPKLRAGGQQRQKIKELLTDRQMDRVGHRVACRRLKKYKIVGSTFLPNFIVIWLNVNQKTISKWFSWKCSEDDIQSKEGHILSLSIKNYAKNAQYTATPGACGWAQAIEVTRSFGHDQQSRVPNKAGSRVVTKNFIFRIISKKESPVLKEPCNKSS